MATIYVPRCGQGMVEDFTAGLGSSSPAALSALASALSSAGIGGGVKASGPVSLSGSFGALPTENTIGSFTVTATGILIFSVGVISTTGSVSAGSSTFLLYLYKNSQKFGGQANNSYSNVATTGFTGAGAGGIVPVSTGDVINIRAGTIGMSGQSVDPTQSYAHYVII